MPGTYSDPFFTIITSFTGAYQGFIPRLKNMLFQPQLKGIARYFSLTIATSKILFYPTTCQTFIWADLLDLVPFVQFEKREKHPWRSVTFSKIAGFTLQIQQNIILHIKAIIPTILKPVKLFIMQVNWLISVWWERWRSVS